MNGHMISMSECHSYYSGECVNRLWHLGTETFMPYMYRCADISLSLDV